ncbi:MAG: hypothetical protein U0X92_18670 [Anaerolineales bacterium]
MDASPLSLDVSQIRLVGILMLAVPTVSGFLRHFAGFPILILLFFGLPATRILSLRSR